MTFRNLLRASAERPDDDFNLSKLERVMSGARKVAALGQADPSNDYLRGNCCASRSIRW